MSSSPPFKSLIKPTFDPKGTPIWTSTMGSSGGAPAVLSMLPDRVIPVIFVPGVMGSNLKQKGVDPKDAVKWRLDSASSAGVWALANHDAVFRKRYLRPETMEVDSEGKISTDTPLPEEELRRRGWGEVGFLSYGTFLPWLENTLNDFNSPQNGLRKTLIGQTLKALKGDDPITEPEVALTYKYRFAVHACGYNWLESNSKSAARLQNCIRDILARYASEKKPCAKVILVTHSMGGMVSRYCSEALGMRDSILGIVHGVMPAIGAAAVYRRFKAGTEDPTAWWNVAGAAASSALGNDAREMTAVLSGAPGPLELLPTAEYGEKWLRIEDGKNVFELPTRSKENPAAPVDPYSQIYTQRGKWWSLCEDQLMNPLNDDPSEKKKAATMDQDWAAYTKTIQGVKSFHETSAGAYHPTTFAFFGSDNKYRAFGTVTWKGDGGSMTRGGRKADVLEAALAEPDQINESRTVLAKLLGTGWATGDRETYKISDPDEPGDGTVPHRSGIAPKEHALSMMQVVAGHEPAYKEGEELERVHRFLIRSIVKIAQKISQTSIAYP